LLLTKTRNSIELHEQGYTVLRDVLDPQVDIQPVIDENISVLKTLILKLNSQGKISNQYDGVEGIDLLNKFVSDTGNEFFDNFNIFLNFHRDPTENDAMYIHPSMFNLLRNASLLDALEQFLGPEIAVNPLHITRIKPPQRNLPTDVKLHPDGSISKTNWHQDLWAFEDSANDTNVITVWVPITQANEQNGCLVVVPGSHKLGELSTHCAPSETNPGFKGIPDQIVSSNRVTLPANPGDVIILDKLTQHCSLENKSDQLRWSYDLRYQSADQPAGQGIRQPWMARSKSNPNSVFKTFEEWSGYWSDIKQTEYNDGLTGWTRFSLNDPLCF